MGSFRPVDRLELVVADGRPALAPFRPRRPRRLDSADYPGYLPPPSRQTLNRSTARCPAREHGRPHILIIVPLTGGGELRACRLCCQPI